MKTSLITKLKVRCSDCDSTITFNIAARPLTEFRCPVCGESLYGNVDHALRTALSYNKAVTETMQCQQEYGVEFISI